MTSYVYDDENETIKNNENNSEQEQLYKQENNDSNQEQPTQQPQEQEEWELLYTEDGAHAYWYNNITQESRWANLTTNEGSDNNNNNNSNKLELFS